MSIKKTTRLLAYHAVLNIWSSYFITADYYSSSIGFADQWRYNTFTITHTLPIAVYDKLNYSLHLSPTKAVLSQVMDVDGILRSLGKFGRYQVLQYAYHLFCLPSLTYPVLIYVFIGKSLFLRHNVLLLLMILCWKELWNLWKFVKKF